MGSGLQVLLKSRNYSSIIILSFFEGSHSHDNADPMLQDWLTDALVLSNANVNCLSLPFDVQEIKEATFNMKGD